MMLACFVSWHSHNHISFAKKHKWCDARSERKPSARELSQKQQKKRTNALCHKHFQLAVSFWKALEVCLSVAGRQNSLTCCFVCHFISATIVCKRRHKHVTSATIAWKPKCKPAFSQVNIKCFTLSFAPTDASSVNRTVPWALPIQTLPLLCLSVCTTPLVLRIGTSPCFSLWLRLPHRFAWKPTKMTTRRNWS